MKKTIKENSINLGDRLAIMSQIKDDTVDFIFTSPPYNVNKDYKNHNDMMDYDEYLEFLNDTWIEAKRILKDGGRIAINVASITYHNEYKALYSDIIQQLLNLDLIMRCEIIWYKQTISNRTAWGSWKSPSNPYVVQPYEFIFVFSKNTKKHTGNKTDIDITRDEFIEYSNSFWSLKPETRLSKKHPAPFPEQLVYRLLKFYTYQNDLVLDMFGGSGTTAVVSKKLNRKYIYIDNSKEYLLFAKQRIKDVGKDGADNKG